METTGTLTPAQAAYPYVDEFGWINELPAAGRDRGRLLDQLKTIARHEDKRWEGGQCSGTMYSGDHELYGFIGDVFREFNHVNVLHRDICPSQTRFEGDILAMTLAMLHGDEVKRRDPAQRAGGVVTTGGSESILSSILAHRDLYRATRGIDRPELILPITAHPAHEKAADLFGIKVIHAPIDRESTQVDVDFVKDKINANTIMLVASAGNYPYGTVDPVEALSDLALHHGIGLHVDGCLGGFILPWGEKLGYDIPNFDFRLPGVSSISADTHKFGYGPKGTSVIAFRDIEIRRHLYFIRTGWPGGRYASPGISGSRSGGLHAATWAVMVSLGQEGYLARARKIFSTADAMKASIGKHNQLRIMGRPTFCISFSSDAFNVYHINDFMRERGWRFNGQQYPNALHMCVTGPQTQDGLAELFDRDLAEAVSYANNPPREAPRTGAVYGGRGSESDVDPNDIAALRQSFVAYLDSMLDQPL